MWPAPDNIFAATTLADANESTDKEYGGFNLADHVGDNQKNVKANRASLYRQIASECSTDADKLEECWLTQTHSAKVVAFNSVPEAQEADAIFSSDPLQICAVLTADCLPVLLCSHDGTHIAAVHAGWRGLAGGIINHAVEALVKKGCTAKKLYAWLGPAIGPQQFEVGSEVRTQFLNAGSHLGNNRSLIEAAFTKHVDEEKFLADIYQLGTLALQQSGIHHIYGGGFCTVSDERFYSFRRSPITGRMATFIVRK